MSTQATSAIPLPEYPYRGLEPYRFCDRAVFFERETEAERLLRLVTMYRGSLLYGESGAGKSSLINAGFIPNALEAGIRVERLRVQPRLDHEFVVERIPRSAAAGDFLRSALTEPGSQQTSLNADEFLQRVHAAGDSELLLIFDQFEELLTQAGGPDGGDSAGGRRILETIVGLLQDRKRTNVRLLFVFREDYLAKFDRLFYFCPELTDRFMRLTSPPASALHRMIRGPFESSRIPPGHWGREIPVEVAAALEQHLRPVDEGRRINLSQVQIAALELWRSDNPGGVLAERGVDGLVSDYLRGQLGEFRENRDLAEALLALMITRQGTRKVIAESEILDDIAREEGASGERARAALEQLVSGTRLVRRDFNRGVTTYEIVSEFLVPWIRTLKLQRTARKARRFWLKRAALFVLLIGTLLGGIFYWKFTTTTEAARRDQLVKVAEASLSAANQKVLDLTRTSESLQNALRTSANDRERKLLDELNHVSAELEKQGQVNQNLSQQLDKAEKSGRESLQALDEEKKGRTAEQAQANSRTGRLQRENTDLNATIRQLQDRIKDPAGASGPPVTNSKTGSQPSTATSERKREYEGIYFIRYDALEPLRIRNRENPAYVFVVKKKVGDSREANGALIAVILAKGKSGLDTANRRDTLQSLRQFAAGKFPLGSRIREWPMRGFYGAEFEGAGVEKGRLEIQVEESGVAIRSSTVHFAAGDASFELLVSFDVSPPIAVLYSVPPDK